MLIAFVDSLVTQYPSHLGGVFLETFVCRIIIKSIVIVSHWGILLARVYSVSKVVFGTHFSKEMYLCSCRSFDCSRFDAFFRSPLFVEFFKYAYHVFIFTLGE